jgi:hypothetical protein
VRLNPSSEAQLGKVVVNAKAMLIRINIEASLLRSDKTQHLIDMISVVFFPDNIPGSGRPGK